MTPTKDTSDVVAAAHYRVGNPSAWSEGYDETISEEIRALLALISSLVAENERLTTKPKMPPPEAMEQAIRRTVGRLKHEYDYAKRPDWDGVLRNELSDLFTTFAAMLSDTFSRASEAERLLAEARAEQPDMETFVRWLRVWTKARHGVWITHNTAKGAFNDYLASIGGGNG
jgi:hypothetical protein